MKRIMNTIITFLFVDPLTEENKPVVITREQIIAKAREILNYLRQFKRSDYESHSFEENHTEALAEFKYKYDHFRGYLRIHSIGADELCLATSELDDFSFIAIL